MMPLSSFTTGSFANSIVQVALAHSRQSILQVHVHVGGRVISRFWKGVAKVREECKILKANLVTEYAHSEW